MGSEIIFVVPYLAAFMAAATIGGTFLIWLVWVATRRLGSLTGRGKRRPFPTKQVAVVFLGLSLPFGCAWVTRPVTQPASARTIAAFETPLSTDADRNDYLAIVRREAEAQGLEVTVETSQDLDVWEQMSPDLRATISATVWRDEPRNNEAYISDRHHLGYAWISFTRGKHPELARRYRERVMTEIIVRWPATLSVPVAETGALPHRKDLVRGPQGYEINPARLADYKCRPTEPAPC
ncbi:MAG: hypothetical protein EON87_14165 [Brevundimonas sp.]|nr:MAG: hypothetical protein EON87_14165 [Brevundimonas sp.]